ncbi:hypothetical protein CEXT_706581 [Caerostris extrusa]|uniref:Uncharacterized protein n=1 Tax=Caerostris extrusa TaxID=172846 RepID=A0AAV4XRC1_CAEEX|nr:hypothetical protein CEXT_706581 [Caerostris extrusa]
MGCRYDGGTFHATEEEFCCFPRKINNSKKKKEKTDCHALSVCGAITVESDSGIHEVAALQANLLNTGKIVYRTSGSAGFLKNEKSFMDHKRM